MEILRSCSNVLYIGHELSVNNFTSLPIYGSVIKANQYFALRLEGMKWESVDNDTKVRALVSATRQIECLNFYGIKSSEDQPLQFPRGSDLTIPVAIEQATYELALVLLKGINPDQERDNLNAQTQVYGSIRKDYNRQIIPMHIVHGIPSPTAWNLLLPFLIARDELLICRVG